ncbi:spore gernimation protein [Paenibacillus sp. CAA11]|uniref:GerAB/ArcD/ProY family transporter n=1 Tax=Paenibacillus sp. CAA11 TaxID=1532905 RepID=UPI000D3C5FEA|nr:GerAB/ArcD/ProY family transporter [Paenibacillus sp. CAA11]AWB46328.1 spore gernimation protein [Paenibacillus sp. CAA11]
MEKIRISSLQFFALMVQFLLGTALVVNLGIQAGKDAWLSILLGMLGGVMMFAVYAYLFKVFPDVLPTTYSRKMFGKVIGTLMALLYCVFFVYNAARDLRDGGALITISSLPSTPIFIVNTLMILAIAYTLHKGIEVLARTAFVFMNVILLIGMFSTALLLFSDVIEINRVLPLLEKGIKPVLMAVVRQNYGFPFGEIVCFAMLLPYLRSPSKGIKAGYGGIIFSGLILSYTMFMNIAVMGDDIVDRSFFPLLTTIGKGSISDFIQRADVLVVMVLIIGDFFKVAVYFYTAVLGISDVFGIAYRKLVYPMALAVLLLSIMVAKGITQHLEEGGKYIYRVSPLFFVVLPIVLAIGAWVYKRTHSGRA